MATYGQLQDNLADYFNRTDLTAAIQTAIKKAIKYYERESFWFNDANLSFSTVSGTQAYTMSTTDGYSAIHQVMVTSNGSRFEVTRKNLEELNAMDASNATGVPSIYAEENGLIRFYPKPNATFTVSVNYATKFATLSATTDSNAFTANAEDLIEARAEWWVRLHKLKDYNGAQAVRMVEEDALRALRGESTQKETSGRIKPTTF